MREMHTLDMLINRQKGQMQPHFIHISQVNDLCSPLEKHNLTLPLQIEIAGTAARISTGVFLSKVCFITNVSECGLQRVSACQVLGETKIFKVELTRAVHRASSGDGY